MVGNWLGMSQWTDLHVCLLTKSSQGVVYKVYWYISQISGERIQDHWSSGYITDKVLISVVALFVSYLGVLLLVLHVPFMCVFI